MLYVGGDLLFLRRSTIGAIRLNCRVRNENGCTPDANPPTYKIHTNLGYFIVLNTVK